MEFARRIKDQEKGGRATLVLACPEDEALRKKFYKQVFKHLSLALINIVGLK